MMNHKRVFISASPAGCTPLPWWEVCQITLSLMSGPTSRHQLSHRHFSAMNRALLISQGLVHPSFSSIGEDGQCTRLKGMCQLASLKANFNSCLLRSSYLGSLLCSDCFAAERCSKHACSCQARWFCRYFKGALTDIHIPCVDSHYRAALPPEEQGRSQANESPNRTWNL